MTAQPSQTTDHNEPTQTPLVALGLSLRTHNALARAGIATVEQLRALSVDTIPTMRNFGVKSVEEIIGALDRYRALQANGQLLSFRETVLPEGPCAPGEVPLREAIGLSGYLRDTIWLPDLQLQIRTYGILERAGVFTVNELADFSREGFFRLRNVGSHIVQEVALALHRLWRALPPEALSDVPVGPFGSATEPQTVEDHLDATIAAAPEEIGAARSLLVPDALAAEVALAGIPIDSLPLPGRLPPEVVQLLGPIEFPTLRDLFILYATRGPAHRVHAGSISARLRAALEKYLRSVLQAFNLLYPGGHTGPPALPDDSLRLIDLLALLCTALNERQVRILSSRSGFQTGVKITLSDLAAELGVTRERIRQIEVAAVLIISVPPSLLLAQVRHDLFEILQLCLDALSGAATLEELVEYLNSVDAIGPLAPVPALSFLLEQTGALTRIDDEVYALPTLDFPGVTLSEIQQAAIAELRAERTQIKLSDLVLEIAHALPIHPPIDRVRLVEIAVKSHPRMLIDEDLLVGLRGWDRKWTDELIRAVRELRRPAHFSKIATVTNALLPPGRQVDEHNVHAMMQRLTDVFVRTGRGIYGLVEWNLPQDRTTPDAAYRVLQHHGKPLRMALLVERVLENRHVLPSTVQAMVYDDPRFCRLGDEIGLCEWATAAPGPAKSSA